jgi:hypothetical protein
MNMVKDNQKTSEIIYDHKTAVFASAFDPRSTKPKDEHKRKRGKVNCME